MLFRSFGLSPTVDDANAVESYLLSRDAVRTLEQNLPIGKMFGRENVDIFARFPHFYLWPHNSFERLYAYYLERVSIIRDPATGITALRVIAFDPADAQQIARQLLVQAEAMVNSMNARALSNSVKSSSDDVARSEERMADAQKALTRFRNQAQIMDPASTSSSILDTITTLSTELASATAQTEEMRRSSPSNPSIFSMTEKIASLQGAIEGVRLKIAGGDNALAAKLESYDRLLLDEKLAENEVEGANVALETARQGARKQSIYLEEVVKPNLSDKSTEPQRLRMIASVFVLAFAVSGVLWLLVAGTKEHMVQ